MASFTVQACVLDRQVSSWANINAGVAFPHAWQKGCWLIAFTPPSPTLWLQAVRSPARSRTCSKAWRPNDENLLRSSPEHTIPPSFLPDLRTKQRAVKQKDSTQIMNRWRKLRSLFWSVFMMRIMAEPDSMTRLFLHWIYVAPLSALPVTSLTRQTPNMQAASKGPSCE